MLKRYLIKFICLFLPSKKLRSKIRMYNNFSIVKLLLYRIQNSKQFFKHKISNKTILIIEPNCFHGEILPGFIKYLQDIEYNVELLIRHEIALEEPFCRMKNPPVYFCANEKGMKEILKSEKIKEYEHLFFSSIFYYSDYGFKGSYFDFIDFLPEAKKENFYVTHELEFFNTFKNKLNSNIFTLCGFRNTKMLNPNYFGVVEITEKSKKNNFICVGALNKNCKNHDLLFENVKKLLATGYKNFTISVIGNGEIKIQKDLKPYIKFLGRLNFPAMYKEMEKADFFLPLLDPTNNQHKRYLDDTTTGSYQLILGFQKPCLINEEFAKNYRFDNTNSIIYKNNDLFIAIKQALKMGNEEYILMQKRIKKLANELYIKSNVFNNRIMEKIK